MNGQAKEQQLQPHDAYIVEERELDEEEEEENDDDSKDSGSAGASSMEDLAKPRGMSVLVCGQPFEHRSQSARRRIKSAQLRHSEQDTVKLAGVKHELYNPALPSLRRMEMDDVGQRLAHEHSRATSALTRKSFSTARTAFYQPPERIPSKRITESGRPLETRLRAQSASLPSRPLPWSDFLQTVNPQTQQRPVTEPGSYRTVTGYTSRYISPAVSQSWKLSLHGTTGVDRQTHTQHLVPAEHNYQYRSIHPQYGQPVIHHSSWR